MYLRSPRFANRCRSHTAAFASVALSLPTLPSTPLEFVAQPYFPSGIGHLSRANTDRLADAPAFPVCYNACSRLCFAALLAPAFYVLFVARCASSDHDGVQ